MSDKHAITDDYILIENDFGIVTCETDLEPKEPAPASEKKSPITAAEPLFLKSGRRLLWEQRNPKVNAKVSDEQGNEVEIREVNRGKQFGFWNDAKNAQIIVHKQNDNTFECKGNVFHIKS